MKTMKKLLAAAHYAKNDGTPFTSETIGMKVDYWDERKDD